MYVEVEINIDMSATSNFFKFKKFKIQDCQRMQSVNNLVTHKNMLTYKNNHLADLKRKSHEQFGLFSL
jgi:hypothetical protein